MTWEEAAQLSDAIAESPDAGSLHANVTVAPGGQAYAVMVREHNHAEMHYIDSMEAFKALCDRLTAESG